MKIKESPLFWPAKFKGNVLYVLDETLIPGQVKYIPVRGVREAVAVIRAMKTRAFGQLLVVLNTFLLEIRKKPRSQEELLRLIQDIARDLNASRPTFPFAEVTDMVVFWSKQAHAARQDIVAVMEKNIQGYLTGIRQRRLDRVKRIAELLRHGDSVLTHCNVSGELAMAAAIAQKEGKKLQFFASETRPYLQGAKLTAWELKNMGARVILVADNAVGSLIADGLVNKVIVGSDRNCANGDFANKIGTYPLAVLAQHFKIPFIVMTQPSSRIKTGKDMPIEIRDEKELLIFNGKRVFPAGVRGFYPGFDVVPRELVTATVPIQVGSHAGPVTREFKSSPQSASVRPKQAAAPTKPRSIVLLLGAFDPKFFDSFKRYTLDAKCWVLEGRPDFESSRETCGQLLKRGVTPTVIADNTAGFLFYQGLVKEVWIAYQTVDSQDVLCPAGAVTLGVMAQKHRIPLFVFPGIKRAHYVGSPDSISQLEGTRTAPVGVKGYVPLIDVLPKKYVKRIIN